MKSRLLGFSRNWTPIILFVVLVPSQQVVARDIYYFWNRTHFNCFAYESPNTGDLTAAGAIAKAIEQSNKNYDNSPEQCPRFCSWTENGQREASGNTEYPWRIPIVGVVSRSTDGVCDKPANDYLYIGDEDVIDTFHHPAASCTPEFGNPIYPFVGSRRFDVDMSTPAGFGFSINYDSASRVPGGDFPSGLVGSAAFGELWGSSLHKNEIKKNHNGGTLGMLLNSGRNIWKSFDEHEHGVFRISTREHDDELRDTGFGNFLLVDRRDFLEEKYATDGRSLETFPAFGGKRTYIYSTGVVAGVSPRAGLLIKVTDHLGHSIQLSYEQPEGIAEPRIYKIIGSDTQETRIYYDAFNNLTQLSRPDGKVKTFLYERADLPWALTGVVDEDNKRYATYGYDAEGRATSTEHAGGTNKYVAQWTTPPRWNISETYDDVVHVIWRDHSWTLPVGTQVQDPLGYWTDLDAELVNGMPRQATRGQPGGSGCSASDSQLSYDGRGNVTSRVDFNHVRSCRAYASDRNVETYRIEGLAQADVCPADLATYQVPADKLQRKVSTLWHPVWKLEAQRAEPKRITTTVYNGQKDPIKNDGVEVVCAAAAPVLPDGSKIVVVCRRYEQSTDDETGNLGFTAPVKETRIWNYTYNQYGQVLTETDPRGKPTTYEYWLDTVFTGERGHWLGDLKKVTNALSQTTNHLEYNKRGQVLTTQLPNGSTEQREYHARGWLMKVTLVPAGGGMSQVTQYDYYDTGLLKKVTQPDGSFASYTWDAAHRLTDVTDSVGNKVHYELDNAGNRTAEQFKDPQGTLAKTITRTFDALGHMSSSTGSQ